MTAVTTSPSTATSGVLTTSCTGSALKPVPSTIDLTAIGEEPALPLPNLELK